MDAARLSTSLRPRAPGAVSLVTLGTMNFGGRTDEAEAKRIVARASERGVWLFDTANVYEKGASERILGAALKGRGDAVAVATKVGLARGADGVEGLSRERVLAACDESLARLQADVIDLYYLHAPDPKTPIEETLSAVATLLERGKIRAWGVSNFASWQILEMFTIADRSGLARPLVSQVIYNVLVRQIEIEYLRFAARFELHTTVYNPLAGGLLSGTYRPGSAISKGSRFDGNKMYQKRYWSPAMLEHVAALSAIAEKEGCGLVELAYAWVAGRPGVDSILVGPGTLAHLDAALDSLEKSLSRSCGDAIDALFVERQGTDAKYAR